MTDDEPIEPDVLIQTALRLLPVPDHEPDFWARLEQALDAEPRRSIAHTSSGDEQGSATGTTDVVPVVEVVPSPVAGVVPAAMRRRSNLVLSGLAVAAAVAVVVAGASLVRSRVEDDPLDDESPAEADDDAGSTSAGAAPLAAPADEPAAAAVVEWIDAVAAGEMEAAWELLGPESQTYWGSFGDFAAEHTRFAERYGAWRVADPRFLLTPLESASGQLVLVTLVGAVPQEGTASPWTDTFPVRTSGDAAVLELHASAGVMEIVVPEDPAEDGTPASMAADEALVLVVPDGVPAPVLRIDDGPVLVCGESPGTELTDLEGTPARRCQLSPAAGLRAGDHVLIAAVTSADGTSVTAQSATFTVG